MRNYFLSPDVKRNDAAIAKILSAPPSPEGDRHPDAIRRLHQLRANGAGREEAVQAVAVIYPPGGGKHRKISLEELYKAYDGAEKLPLEPWATSHGPMQYRRDFSRLEVNGNKVTYYQHDGSREDLPADDIKCNYSEFLKRILGFRDDEYVWFATKEDLYGEEKFIQSKNGNLVASLTERRPNECCEGDFLPSIDDHSGQGFSDLGTYFAVNPFKTGDWRKADNISRFRYTMVESDKLSREEQLALFKRCGLPIKCLIDTGSKSIHAIITVDAANLDAYNERVERIHEYLGGKEAGFDSTKDPVRFSRLPNCEHAKGRQRLISLECGPASFEEWEFSRQAASTEFFNLDEIAKFNRSSDPDCVIGNRWLCKGGSLIVQGYSGIGKSSLLLQMALSWAVERDFFGLNPVRSLKTVFIQAENDKGDFAEAYQDITKDFSAQDLALLKANFVVGREAAVTGAERFGPYVRGLIAKYRPDILFFDPLLSYFGDDIIKQQAVSRFFRNELQPIQNETGVIIVFNHHLGKPPQNHQQRQGPAHYQGLGSSDIVNWTRETITLTDDGAGNYKLEFGKRAKRAGFKELYLKHSIDGIRWERSAGVNSVEDAKKVAEDKRRTKLEEYVRSWGLVTLQQMKDNASNFGYGKNSIKDALDALSQNSADGENPVYCYKAHVNCADATSTVYSVSPKPKDGHVQSRDINAPDFVVRDNGLDVQL